VITPYDDSRGYGRLGTLSLYSMNIVNCIIFATAHRCIFVY